MLGIASLGRGGGYDPVLKEYEKRLAKIEYDAKKSAALKARFDILKKKYIEQNLPALQEKLRRYFIPRWPGLYRLSENPDKFEKSEILYYFVEHTANIRGEVLLSQANIIITELKDIKAKIEYQERRANKITQKSGEAEGGIQQTSEINKSKGGLLMVTAEASKENWKKIKSEYECSKLELAKKINFVEDEFKRKIILRDVEHAFVLASYGFAKPAVILAGGVIEELLKQYLKDKNIKPEKDGFAYYVKACENNRLLELGVSRLSDAIRDFRNLVHISKEKSKRNTITMATAKGAVSSIFSIANDFH
jgi:hypothetical protein